MRTPLFFPLAWGLLAAVPLHAEVPRVDDLRLVFLPFAGRNADLEGRADTEIPSFSFSEHMTRAVSRDLEHHRRYGLGYYRSIDSLRPAVGSLIWGVEVMRDESRLQQGNITVDGDAVVVDLHLGWGWALTPRWHIEEGVFVGAGLADWEWTMEEYVPGFSPTDSDAAFMADFGFRVGIFYSFTRHLQMGIDLRHTVMRSHARFSDSRHSGDEVHVAWQPEIEISGIGGSISIGYRF